MSFGAGGAWVRVLGCFLSQGELHETDEMQTSPSVKEVLGGFAEPKGRQCRGRRRLRLERGGQGDPAADVGRSAHVGTRFVYSCCRLAGADPF